MREVFFRFSDFQKNVPYQFVIIDLEKNNFYFSSFLKFDAFLAKDGNKRQFMVIFPKYRFRSAYLTFTQKKRKEVGSKNVFMEIYKRDKGVIEITRLEKWKK